MPLIAAGKAAPDPYLDELKEKARRLGQRIDWDKEPQPTRPRAQVVATASDESFASKLTKAVKTLAVRRPQTRKQHAERAAKQRSRYRRLTRRPHTKSD